MYTGLTGALRVGNRTLAYISGWSVNDTAEVIEVAKVGSSHKDAYVGHQSWSASADGTVSFDFEESDIEDEIAYMGAQAALYKAKHDGEPIELRLYLNKATQTHKSAYFSGRGIIESLSVDLSAGQTANISINIKGTRRLDLIVEGRVIKNNAEKMRLDSLFNMKIDGDGILSVVPHPRSPYDFSINEKAGELEVQVLRK